MSVLSQIAFYQGRRDEIPNQLLARCLAELEDTEGIAEIAANLHHRDIHVRNECIKVLYEVGYLRPDLVAQYVEDFLSLLSSPQNRLVWGAMLALATIAPLKADEVFAHLDAVQAAMDAGSVITMDNGIKLLSYVAAARPEYHQALFPRLLQHLRTARQKEVPAHAEMVLVAVTPETREAFIAVLQARFAHATPAQASRLRKIIRSAQAVAG